MRRALGSLLIGLGLIVGSLTLSAWWTSQTVLDSQRTARVADAVLDNRAVRRELARLVSDRVVAAMPPELAASSTAFRPQVEAALADTDLSGPLSGVLVGVHQRLLGERTGPVTLDPAVVQALVVRAVPGVGTEVLAGLPVVSFDVPEAAPLATARRELPGILRWGLAACLALVAAGFVVHPRRDRALTRLGWWLLGASVAQLLFLYLLPVVVAPAVAPNAWTGFVAGVATAGWSGLVSLLAAMAVGGVGCLLAGWSWTAAGRPRRRPSHRRRTRRAVAAGAPADAPATRDWRL